MRPSPVLSRTGILKSPLFVQLSASVPLRLSLLIVLHSLKSQKIPQIDEVGMDGFRQVEMMTDRLKALVNLQVQDLQCQVPNSSLSESC